MIQVIEAAAVTVDETTMHARKRETRTVSSIVRIFCESILAHTDGDVLESKTTRIREMVAAQVRHFVTLAAKFCLSKVVLLNAGWGHCCSCF